MKYLLYSVFLLVGACAAQDQAVRSRIQSVGLSGSGNVETGDILGSVVVTLRDPRTSGLSK